MTITFRRVDCWDDLLAIDLPDDVDVKFVDQYLQAAYQTDAIWVAECRHGAAAFLGISPMWNGVAEAWIVPGKPFLTGSGRLIARHLKRQLIGIMMEMGLHRLQAHCAGPEASRLAAVCGLWREGEAHGYGPDGRDYSRYAIVLRGK